MKKIMYSIITFLLPASAFAQTLDIPDTLSLNDYYTAAGVVITAIFGVWIVRKVIKLGNRS